MAAAQTDRKRRRFRSLARSLSLLCPAFHSSSLSPSPSPWRPHTRLATDPSLSNFSTASPPPQRSIFPLLHPVFLSLLLQPTHTRGSCSARGARRLQRACAASSWVFSPFFLYNLFCFFFVFFYSFLFYSFFSRLIVAADVLSSDSVA